MTEDLTIQKISFKKLVESFRTHKPSKSLGSHFSDLLAANGFSMSPTPQNPSQLKKKLLLQPLNSKIIFYDHSSKVGVVSTLRMFITKRKEVEGVERTKSNPFGIAFTMKFTDDEHDRWIPQDNLDDVVNKILTKRMQKIKNSEGKTEQIEASFNHYAVPKNYKEMSLQDMTRSIGETPNINPLSSYNLSKVNVPTKPSEKPQEKPPEDKK